LIEEFNHLHLDHQNPICDIRIFEALKAKGAPIHSCVKKLNKIQSTATYPLLYNEVNYTLSSLIWFRNTETSGSAEELKEKQFLESFKTFQSEVGPIHMTLVREHT